MLDILVRISVARITQEHLIQMVLESPRDETEREHRKHHDGTLVEHIDNDVR